jgi:hypothetical protein
VAPLDVRFGTLLTADALAAFWLNVSVLLLYVAYGCERVGSRAGVAVLAGLALISAWLTKEIVVYAAPLVVLVWVLFVRSNRDYWIVASVCAFTVLAGVLGESLYYLRQTGDWLFRYHEIERNYGLSPESFFSEGGRLGWAPGYYWQGVLRRVFKDGPRALFLKGMFGGVTLVAVIAIGYGLVRRLGIFYFPAVWFMSLVFIFNFGSTSLRSYRPLAIGEGPSEYLYPVLLPAILLAAVLFHTLMPDHWPVARDVGRERAFWGLCLAGGVILSLVSSLYWAWARGPESPVERVVYRRLSPHEVVLTDIRTARALFFFWKFPSNSMGLLKFEGMERQNVPEDAYVLINRWRIEHSRKAYGKVPPDFVDRPPKEWDLIWAGHGGELYRAGRRLQPPP